MSDAVEGLFENLAEAATILLELKQPSLSIALDDVHRKALLLAAASFFEHRLTESVMEYSGYVAGKDSPLANLVKSKAVSRQYHTWFNWDASNANTFFALFGKSFREYMELAVKDDERLSGSIKAFLSLGSDRNRLVHRNFGAFSLEADPREIVERYREALYFVDKFPEYLQNYNQADQPPAEAG